MPIINVTQADLLKTKVFEAGWYPAKIAKISALTTSKAGNSLNLTITFALGGLAVGKEIDETFNSQLWGKLAPVFKAATGKDMDPGQFDTDQLLGKDCDAQLITDTYNGNLMNRIANYLPLGKGNNQATF